MMRYKGYYGKVEYDPQANILHGEVVGIRDVITFQARSVDEVEQAFRDSVDDYLDFCKARREKPDKPCSGKLVVRISSELHRKLAALADLSGKSINSLISEHLQQKVEKEFSVDSRPGRRSPARKSASRRMTKQTGQLV